jgi:two-component system LytT family response regulator
MKTLRCLLVDDERLARVELSALLTEAGDCTVVGEAANAEESVKLITSLKPDVLFLDINMPRTNGFELLGQLDTPPPVVFVSAYYEFAVKAFTVRAFDYLLKPVRPQRLAATLARLREQLASSGEERIFLPHANGGRFVKLADITLVRAYDHYVRIYHPEGSDMLREPFSTFINRLPTGDFFQANRSAYVRVSSIEKLERISRGRYLLSLSIGEQETVSEKQGVEWRRRLGELA